MAVETKKTPDTGTANKRKKAKRPRRKAAGKSQSGESAEAATPAARQVDLGEVARPAGETTQEKKAPSRRGKRRKKKATSSQPESTTTSAQPTSTSTGSGDRASAPPPPPQQKTTDAPPKKDPFAPGSGISRFTGPTLPKKGKQSAAAREMIINVSEGHECRVAVLNDGKLEEFFIERTATLSNVGNIYKGIVTNVEPSIQAAFIDFGKEKNGFLHISDVQPQYFPDHSGPGEDVGRKTPRHHRPPIQKCFRRGQEVIVQITKEGVGTKGPTLTSYISIPGRFLVMMPGMSRHGVSRKIEDEDARNRMKDVMKTLEIPDGMGCILRTAGLDRTKRDLQRDLTYLQRLWKTVAERVKRMSAPAELYRESDLVTRTIRDVYSTDFSRIVVDHTATARRAREFLRIAMPRTKSQIELYTDREPLFHRMGIETELDNINMRHVPLASGGSIVIDSTEALVAIDVNSGRFRSPVDAEETALRINIEAAEEIARQLRLRDLGGLIVCDFIDLRLDRNKRKVENALRDGLKKHKEKARILRMSAFGLIEMTRQRQGPALKRNTYHDCPHCSGSGLVKMPESVMLDAMRVLQVAGDHPNVATIRISLAPEVAYQLLNTRRRAIHDLETETKKRVHVKGDASFAGDQIQVVCQDSRGQEVSIGGNS